MTVSIDQLNILLSCLAAWFLSQVVKALLNLWQQRELNPLQAIFATGGMPSAHAASVSALAAAIFLHEGVSTAFAVALILMFVTLRDAVGVRLAAGEQARVLNDLVAKLNHDHPALHVDHGHTVAQVVVGVFVGIAAAMIVMELS
ncbi:MAG: divergent PAP2 family protein [Caldilineaceae bacterium]|nr:divergent PAP2 family protein [Caldilineaceae bacterium]